jgi:hypothetical protein
MKKNRRLLLRSTSLILLLSIFSCSPLIATFDQASYEHVTSLKVDALALMDKCNEDYSLHAADVAAFQLNMDKAIEYDKHRPKDSITTRQWEILNNPNGHLLGAFLVLWKKDKILDTIAKKMGTKYFPEKKKQISDAFDQIAELESGKLKPKQVTN